MEKINLPFFYLLGAKLNPLTQMSPAGASRLQVLMVMFNARDYVNSLLNQFPGLTVCRPAGLALIQAIHKWTTSWSTDKMSEPIDPPEEFEVRGIVTKAKDFETVLSAEMQTLATYHAEQKGIYSTADLIERAEYTLPESARERLPQQVLEEIRQSGRCLAFDNSTSAGFHIMRATEAVMHPYYITVCKPKPKPKKRLQSWGAYLAELRKINDGDVQKVVAILQQIKDQDRNLIMHPEVVLSTDEAFTLFETAQGAIMAMAGKLPMPKKPKK